MKVWIRSEKSSKFNENCRLGEFWTFNQQNSGLDEVAETLISKMLLRMSWELKYQWVFKQSFIFPTARFSDEYEKITGLFYTMKWAISIISVSHLFLIMNVLVYIFRLILIRNLFVNKVQAIELNIKYIINKYLNIFTHQNYIIKGPKCSESLLCKSKTF